VLKLILEALRAPDVASTDGRASSLVRVVDSITENRRRFNFRLNT